MSSRPDILFPTDFTKDARKAYRYALEICTKMDARLHIFHAIEEPYDFATRVEETIENSTRQAQAKIETMMDKARSSEKYASLPIFSEIKRGKPLPSIKEKAADLDANLIILGTKGESSLRRILYGNVTSSIILESEIPVFTVPVKSKKPYLDRFLFATDYRDGDINALEKTINFARHFDAEIHVFHVSTSQQMVPKIKFKGFKQMVKKKFDYPKLKFKRVVAEDFSHGMSAFLNDNAISAMVITRYKKKFLQTLMWANTTQDLTYHSRVPMMIQLPD